MTAETPTGSGRSPWLFLLGVLAVLGSLALLVYDLLNGNDIARGLVANAGAVAGVLVLAGRETLSNPDSDIRTRGEAARAVLFFYGIYLLLAGCLGILLGRLFHPDPRMGVTYAAPGALVVVVTFLTGGEADITDRLSTLVGLVGLLAVVGSVPLFAYDLLTGGDVLRGIATNGVGAALFILWTAYDMPADPDSGVETLTDALGVALLFYGSYLLLAGGVIALTGLLAHGRGEVGLLYLGLGAVTLVPGVLFAPLGAFTDAGAETS